MALFYSVIMYTVKILMYNCRTFASEDNIGISKHVFKTKNAVSVLKSSCVKKRVTLQYFSQVKEIIFPS